MGRGDFLKGPESKKYAEMDPKKAKRAWYIDSALYWGLPGFLVTVGFMPLLGVFSMVVYGVVGFVLGMTIPWIYWKVGPKVRDKLPSKWRSAIVEYLPNGDVSNRGEFYIAAALAGLIFWLILAIGLFIFV